MKLLRVAIAVLLTVALLVIARQNSRGRSEIVTVENNFFTFTHETVPKALADSSAIITTTIDPPFSSDHYLILHFQEKQGPDMPPLERFTGVPMRPTGDGRYGAEVPTGARGGRLWYYIELTDYVDRPIARLVQLDGQPFVLKFIGEVPGFVLVGHIFYIFATVLFVFLGAIQAWTALRSNGSLKPMARHFLIAAIFAFIGGYPFGFAMNWYAFGGFWEGVPFGTDATDNKTQLLLVYLVLVAALSYPALKGREENLRYGRSATAWFGLSAVAVLLAIYLIPHSIQFSAVLTYVVCYSFIGFTALLYLLPRLGTRSATA